jgi:hypothetical protein
MSEHAHASCGYSGEHSAGRHEAAILPSPVCSRPMADALGANALPDRDHDVRPTCNVATPMPTSRDGCNHFATPIGILPAQAMLPKQKATPACRIRFAFAIALSLLFEVVEGAGSWAGDRRVNP